MMESSYRYPFIATNNATATANAAAKKKAAAAAATTRADASPVHRSNRVGGGRRHNHSPRKTSVVPNTTAATQVPRHQELLERLHHVSLLPSLSLLHATKKKSNIAERKQPPRRDEQPYPVKGSSGTWSRTGSTPPRTAEESTDGFLFALFGHDEEIQIPLPNTSDGSTHRSHRWTPNNKTEDNTNDDDSYIEKGGRMIRTTPSSSSTPSSTTSSSSYGQLYEKPIGVGILEHMERQIRLANERTDRGQCKSCGRQLYELRPSNRNNSEAVPATSNSSPGNSSPGSCGRSRNRRTTTGSCRSSSTSSSTSTGIKKGGNTGVGRHAGAAAAGFRSGLRFGMSRHGGGKRYPQSPKTPPPSQPPQTQAPQKYDRIPLTIPDKVYQGRCLECFPLVMDELDTVCDGEVPETFHLSYQSLVLGRGVSMGEVSGVTWVEEEDPHEHVDEQDSDDEEDGAGLPIPSFGRRKTSSSLIGRTIYEGEDEEYDPTESSALYHDENDDDDSLDDHPWEEEEQASKRGGGGEVPCRSDDELSIHVDSIVLAERRRRRPCSRSGRGTDATKANEKNTNPNGTTPSASTTAKNHKDRVAAMSILKERVATERRRRRRQQQTSKQAWKYVGDGEESKGDDPTLMAYNRYSNGDDSYSFHLDDGDDLRTRADSIVLAREETGRRSTARTEQNAHDINKNEKMETNVIDGSSWNPSCGTKSNASYPYPPMIPSLSDDDDDENANDDDETCYGPILYARASSSSWGCCATSSIDSDRIRAGLSYPPQKSNAFGNDTCNISTADDTGPHSPSRSLYPTREDIARSAEDPNDDQDEGVTPPPTDDSAAAAAAGGGWSESSRVASTTARSSSAAAAPSSLYPDTADLLSALSEADARASRAHEEMISMLSMSTSAKM